MKNISTWILARTIVMFVIVLFWGCKGEPKKDMLTLSSLKGKWYIIDALRNGRKTKSLESGFFEFGENGKVITNIFGSNEQYNYSFKDKKIVIDSPQELKMEIIKYVPDTIFSSIKLKLFQVDMLMVKNIPDNTKPL